MGNSQAFLSSLSNTMKPIFLEGFAKYNRPIFKPFAAKPLAALLFCHLQLYHLEQIPCSRLRVAKP